MPLSELLNLYVCEVGKGARNSWSKLFSRGDVASCFCRSSSFFRFKTISVAADASGALPRGTPSTFNGKLKSCGDEVLQVTSSLGPRCVNDAGREISWKSFTNSCIIEGLFVLRLLLPISQYY